MRARAGLWQRLRPLLADRNSPRRENNNMINSMSNHGPTFCRSLLGDIVETAGSILGLIFGVSWPRLCVAMYRVSGASSMPTQSGGHATQTFRSAPRKAYSPSSALTGAPTIPTPNSTPIQTPNRTICARSSRAPLVSSLSPQRYSIPRAR